MTTENPSGADRDATPRGPYEELFRNVPEPMRRVLATAADGAAAQRWLKEGITPDPDKANGLDPGRMNLKRIDLRADGTREIDWCGERYINDEEDLEDLEEAIDITCGIQGKTAKISYSLEFRDADIICLSLAPMSDEDSFEGVTPAGSYVAITEYAQANKSRTYHGLYLTTTRSELHDDIPTPPGARVWLNATAERLLAQVLT